MSKYLIDKSEIMGPYRTHDSDTGSSFVQVALLSTRITGLSKHLLQHPKDNSCKRTLLQLVAIRLRFLRYIKKNFPTRYDGIVKQLNIRVSKSFSARS